VVSSRESHSLTVRKANITIDKDLRILNCEQINIYTILGSDVFGYEEGCLVGYNAVESVEKSADVSEEYFASISILRTLKLEAKQETGMKKVPDNWFVFVSCFTYS
jgi:hypothetical protein